MHDFDATGATSLGQLRKQLAAVLGTRQRIVALTYKSRKGREVCVSQATPPLRLPPLPPLPCLSLHMHHIHAMTCVVVQVLCPLSLVLLCPSTFSQATHGRRVFRALFEANPNSTSDTPMAGSTSSPQPSPATVTEQQPGQQRAHHRGRVTLDTSHQTPERAALEGHGRYCSVCNHTDGTNDAS